MRFRSQPEARVGKYSGVLGRQVLSVRHPHDVTRPRPMNERMPETLSLEGDGSIPNSPLPVLIYQGVELASDPGRAEQALAENDWSGSWRGGIYDFHHFHSIAHEVLAVVAGSARVALGGPNGQVVTVRSGDVLVLPAGTGHCNLGSDGLRTVGAYPHGMPWDLRRGDPAEYDEVLANIAAVPLPGSDPVYGPGGPLTELWNAG